MGVRAGAGFAEGKEVPAGEASSAGSALSRARGANSNAAVSPPVRPCLQADTPAPAGDQTCAAHPVRRVQVFNCGGRSPGLRIDRAPTAFPAPWPVAFAVDALSAHSCGGSPGWGGGAARPGSLFPPAAGSPPAAWNHRLQPRAPAPACQRSTGGAFFDLGAGLHPLSATQSRILLWGAGRRCHPVRSHEEML